MITKTTTPRRWGDALSKVEAEGRCRNCGAADYIEAAHVIGKHVDPILVGPKGGEYRYVHPDSIIPLCGSFSDRNCHTRYDRRSLDVLPILTIREQRRAMEDAGGTMSMLKRVSPMGGQW